MGALITAKENFHAVSLSGGKDSTCLLLLMIERGLPIDAVIWADTGMEFPEMYGHISKGGRASVPRAGATHHHPALSQELRVHDV